MQSYKILLYNCAHCRGYDGSILQYVSGWARSFSAPRRNDRRVSEIIYGAIEQEKPDLCLLAEIKENSRLISLLRQRYDSGDVRNKYGSSSLRYLPWSQRKSNAFFGNGIHRHTHHELGTGTKRLLYEIALTEKTSLLFGHFAVGKAARSRQFASLSGYLSPGKSHILCGDFNAFHGEKELRLLMEMCNLRLANDLTVKTFPSYRPAHALDLFFHSSDIIVDDVRVPDSLKLSDHLPIILSCSVP